MSLRIAAFRELFGTLVLGSLVALVILPTSLPMTHLLGFKKIRKFLCRSIKGDFLGYIV